MKVKTNELTGAVLSWAVDWAESGYPLKPFKRVDNGELAFMDTKHGVPMVPVDYASSWARSGPIIDRHVRATQRRDGYHYASIEDGEGGWFWSYGKDLLEAGLRVFVMSRLGREIDVPEELLK